MKANVVKLLSVTMLMFGVAALAESPIWPGLNRSNTKTITGYGVNQNWAVANQQCQQSAQQAWYQAGAECSAAGGQLIGNLFLQCNPSPGPNFNWQSMGQATVTCTVPAFQTTPVFLPQAE